MSFPEGVFLVQSGDIDNGMWGFNDELFTKDNVVIEMNDLASCALVSDRHENHQTGTGRIAGGIIGAVLLGPIGAAGGLLAGGKRRVDETIVFCTLRDGRSFSAECSPLTVVKLQNICQQNSYLRSQRLAKTAEASSTVQSNSLPENDTVECPMCAEHIKIKAKICRYCGYKIAEAKEKISSLALSDPTVESVVPIGDLISKFRSACTYEADISDELILDVAKCFSRLMKSNPDKGYRLLVDEVKSELDIPFKTIVNDIVREGFKFIRNGAPFEIENDLVIIRKLPSKP